MYQIFKVIVFLYTMFEKKNYNPVCAIPATISAWFTSKDSNALFMKVINSSLVVNCGKISCGGGRARTRQKGHFNSNCRQALHNITILRQHVIHITLWHVGHTRGRLCSWSSETLSILTSKQIGHSSSIVFLFLSSGSRMGLTDCNSICGIKYKINNKQKQKITDPVCGCSFDFLRNFPQTQRGKQKSKHFKTRRRRFCFFLILL